MSPGLSEQAGKAAVATVDALKSTPALLVLILFNLIVMGVLAYVSVKNGERWDRELTRWVEFAQACQQK